MALVLENVLAGKRHGSGMAALHQHIQPRLPFPRSLVGRHPGADVRHIGQGTQPALHTGLGGIGEGAAQAVHAFAGLGIVAQLVAGIGHATRGQQCPQRLPCVGLISLGQVQQAGAGPQAIKPGVGWQAQAAGPLQLQHVGRVHGQAGVLRGQSGHLGAGVKGRDPVAPLRKGQCIAA